MERSQMIVESHGNLLQADVDALVNTVNTVGVMGKGIALQFRKAYPEMFRAYAAAAKRGELSLGKMHVWETQLAIGPKFIVNFPTKGHWKSPSRLDDVVAGLDDLVRLIERLDIRSVAVPPLGCGNGGLDWSVVEPAIRDRLGALPGVEVLLFPPEGAPSAAEMVIGGKAPKMTPGRAALVELMARYAVHALMDASLIEIQKLMYFLQAAGEPLSLEFEPLHYGPYSDKLRHVLVDVEGHYLRGFGDGSQAVQEAEPLVVLPGARELAQGVLQEHPETASRMDRVLGLIDGFESEDALELLASLHFLIAEDPRRVDDVALATEALRSWSDRKSRMFSDRQIGVAWAALRERGWAPAVV